MVGVAVVDVVGGGGVVEELLEEVDVVEVLDVEDVDVVLEVVGAGADVEVVLGVGTLVEDVELVLVDDDEELVDEEELELLVDVELDVLVVVVPAAPTGRFTSAAIWAVSSARLYTRTSSMRPVKPSFGKPTPMRSCSVLIWGDVVSDEVSTRLPFR